MTDLNRRTLIAALVPLAVPLMSADAQACEGAGTRDVLAAYADDWARRDTGALVSAYHDNFTLFYPGRHALAGVHRGKSAALAALQEIARRTRRELVAVVDIMAGAHEGALHVIERWSTGEARINVERVLVYTLRDGLLYECHLFDGDAALVETFLD